MEINFDIWFHFKWNSHIYSNINIVESVESQNKLNDSASTIIVNNFCCDINAYNQIYE